ncbi:MAG TPA: ThiF family adenylyltransferase [Ktedonobacterales bacterium]|nr:ThiF family adenylyltransferase [Ktedonobacterales bacterium]
MELLRGHFGLARNESGRYHPRAAVGKPTLLRPAATHTQLYSRNWAFITPEVQEQLAQTTVLCVGSGLGSMVALAAAQTGFQRFVLCDGDTVEEHNLNRQAFDRGQIGMNKAQAIGATLASLLPEARIEVVPRFVSSADFSDLVPRADLIINTIDLDSPAFLDLNRVAHQHGKTVLFPLNLGWAGALLVFDQDSQTLDDFIGIESGQAKDAQADAERMLEEAGRPVDLQAVRARTVANSPEAATRLIMRVLESLGNELPAELEALLPVYKCRTPETWPCDPQLGVTAHVTAAITVRACVALVAGQPVRRAPEVILCDTSAAIAPFASAVTTREHEDENWMENETLLAVSAAVRAPEPHAPEPRAPEPDVPPLSALIMPHQHEATELFVAPRVEGRRSYYSAHTRPGTGLVVIVARDDALTPAERAVISAYRLRQYTLAGMYDEALVQELALDGDPAMDAVAGRDLHVAVGDSEGRFLCYLCMQSPMTLTPDLGPAPEPYTALMGDLERPLFPVETEYGLDLYGQHPGIRWLPIASVRELSRLVRNQELAYSPAVEAAPAETILASMGALTDHSHMIEAIVGCIAPEARRLLYNLHVPMAYAPQAPILADNLSGRLPDGRLLWTGHSHASGRFWPYALATVDLAQEAVQFAELDSILAQPNTADVITKLRQWRGRGPARRPRYVVDSDDGSTVWISNPFSVDEAHGK